jgi:hypothetical protein
VARSAVFLLNDRSAAIRVSTGGNLVRHGFVGIVAAAR